MRQNEGTSFQGSFSGGTLWGDFVNTYWNNPHQSVKSNFAKKTRPSKLKGHSREFVLKRRKLKTPTLGSNRKVALAVKMKFGINIFPQGVGWVRRVMFLLNCLLIKFVRLTVRSHFALEKPSKSLTKPAKLAMIGPLNVKIGRTKTILSILYTATSFGLFYTRGIINKTS